MSNLPITDSAALSEPVHTSSETYDETFMPDIDLERKRHDQWFYERVFEDLHMYFEQENSVKYTNPLTKQKWLVTPAINLTIGGTPLSVVAAVLDDEFKLSPIEFLLTDVMACLCVD